MFRVFPFISPTATPHCVTWTEPHRAHPWKSATRRLSEHVHSIDLRCQSEEMAHTLCLARTNASKKKIGAEASSTEHCFPLLLLFNAKPSVYFFFCVCNHMNMAVDTSLFRSQVFECRAIEGECLGVQRGLHHQIVRSGQSDPVTLVVLHQQMVHLGVNHGLRRIRIVIYVYTKRLNIFVC